MGHIRDQVLMLGIEIERFLHAGGTENMLGYVVHEGLSRHFLHDGTAHHEGRVDVLVGRSGREVQVVELGEVGHGKFLIAFDFQFAGNAAAGIRHTGGVGEQVLDLDIFPEICLEFRKIL